MPSKPKLSICDKCSNALPQLCAFIRDDDPEPALVAMGAKAIRSKSKHGETIYKVISCRNYKTGKLLPIPEHKYVNIPVAITAKYDLSCPRCGRNGESVSIASSNQVKPESWYCRCSVCNKSFSPKRKETKHKMQTANENQETCSSNTEQASSGGFKIYKPNINKRPKTRLETARDKLSKEMYLGMKAEGLSDNQLRKQLDIASDIMTALKKEWGLKMNASFAPDSTGQPRPNVTIAQLIDIHDELEEEVENLDWLLDQERNIPVVKSIRLLLDERRCESARRLKRIHDVFNSVTVAI